MTENETDTDEQELLQRLAELKQQHRDLDDAIESLEDRGFSDQLQLRRLKKQKLFLKDEISKVEDQVLPDIIACTAVMDRCGVPCDDTSHDPPGREG